MSTSIVYLRKRLIDLERFDLLAAVDAGQLSHYGAATAAGIVTRPPVAGTGSDNRARRRAFAIMRAEGRLPLLPPAPPSSHDAKATVAPLSEEKPQPASVPSAKSDESPAEKPTAEEAPPPFDPRGYIG